MDMLPIKPSNNLIKPTIGTANDGGSKSQSGYVNVRTGQPEGDKIQISDESKRLIGEDPIIEEKNFFEVLKEFFIKIFRSISKIFSFKLTEKSSELEITEKIEEKTEEIIEDKKLEEKNETKDFLKFTKHDNQ